jgi:hypothetical protein
MNRTAKQKKKKGKIGKTEGQPNSRETTREGIY